MSPIFFKISPCAENKKCHITIRLPEHVCQGQNLQKSLNISYYMTDFNKSFIKKCSSEAGNKNIVISSDLENVDQANISENEYIIYYQIDFSTICFKMITPLQRLWRTGPHYIAQERRVSPLR